MSAAMKPNGNLEDWTSIGIYESRKERIRKSDSPRNFGGIKTRKVRNYRNSHGRLVNTREYAIAWGVLNKPYSSEELKRKCREDPEAPSFSFIVRKCWNGYTRYYNALVEAGMRPRRPRSDKEKRRIIGKASNNGFKNGLLEKDYEVAKMAAQYGVKNGKDYERIRHEHPESKVFLPSTRAIIRRFGTWRRFFYEVMKYNADATLTEYVLRSSEVGHWLRISECDELHIPIRSLMDLLRPALFNVLCYRKMRLLGLDGTLKSNGGISE